MLLRVVKSLTFFTRQAGKFIDLLTCVLAVWYAETEYEVERFQQFVLKEMPFNHAEIGHSVIANNKLHTKTVRNYSFENYGKSTEFGLDIESASMLFKFCNFKFSCDALQSIYIHNIFSQYLSHMYIYYMVMGVKTLVFSTFTGEQMKKYVTCEKRVCSPSYTLSFCMANPYMYNKKQENQCCLKKI